MKVRVIPIDKHTEDMGLTRFDSEGEPFEGKHLVVNRDRVLVDLVEVIRRDRRPIAKRHENHPWLTDNGHPENNWIGWTGFRVEVEP